MHILVWFFFKRKDDSLCVRVCDANSFHVWECAGWDWHNFCQQRLDVCKLDQTDNKLKIHQLCIWTARPKTIYWQNASCMGLHGEAILFQFGTCRWRYMDSLFPPSSRFIAEEAWIESRKYIIIRAWGHQFLLQMKGHSAKDIFSISRQQRGRAVPSDTAQVFSFNVDLFVNLCMVRYPLLSAYWIWGHHLHSCCDFNCLCIYLHIVIFV